MGLEKIIKFWSGEGYLPSGERIFFGSAESIVSQNALPKSAFSESRLIKMELNSSQIDYSGQIAYAKMFSEEYKKKLGSAGIVIYTYSKD